MMDNQHKLCPKVEAAFEIIGKRWTGLIILTLMDGPKRFKDMAESITNMSDRMLAERLKELEAAGLVIRSVYPEIPVRIEYSLTDKGKSLQHVLQEVQTWADQWMELKDTMETEKSLIE